MRHKKSGQIAIRKVEQGQGSDGCNPRGVQILFKDVTHLEGKPNLAYLKEFFESREFEVKEVAGVENTPFLRICVQKHGSPLSRTAVIALLREDPELDVSGIEDA